MYVGVCMWPTESSSINLYKYKYKYEYNYKWIISETQSMKKRNSLRVKISIKIWSINYLEKNLKMS